MTTVVVELEHETCWCGMPFMLPKDLRYNARNRGHTIYCPLGHTITWKETEETRLRRDRDRLAQRIAERDDEIKRQCELREATERRLSAAKGRITKISNRVGRGVCPCCNRQFSNLHRHMVTEHPTFTAEAAE